LAASLSRAIVIVLDSAGIGELPDAAAYGDEGSNTLGHICESTSVTLPTLQALGLGCIAPLQGVLPAPLPGSPDRLRQGCGGPPKLQAKAEGLPHVPAAFGRMAERSPGKDSVTGHWEMMGIVLDRAFPTFPDGFPRDLIARFEARIGRSTLGNVVASGTEIIARLGAQHMQSGAPIVYTSADSVFQIAAHESVVSVPELYRICEIAYELAVDGAGLGRVIARPFTGAPGAFVRTANRRDYAMPPKELTLLDYLTTAGVPVVAIGKIADLFAHRGVTRAVHTASDDEVMDAIAGEMNETEAGLIFANLVDFDTQFGHRNDTAGYAANLERFDARLPRVLAALRTSDLLVVTADHGNDPTTPSTDHSREYVPLLVTGRAVRPGVDLGTRSTFADLGQTLAEVFGVGPLAAGRSFLRDLTGAGGPGTTAG
jgi:phosphopentomutase